MKRYNARTGKKRRRKSPETSHKRRMGKMVKIDMVCICMWLLFGVAHRNKNKKAKIHFKTFCAKT